MDHRDFEDLYSLGRNVEAELKAIRTRLGVLIFLLLVPFCIGFGAGLYAGLVDSGSTHTASAIAGAGAPAVLLMMIGILAMAAPNRR